ncbi:MAG: hypothetical protein MJZ69_09850 [Bacteroidaceae bacterium]|nr:hypothetical protein [Bacteroidaceae bacterium]MDO4957448.1 hypothetical protein [Bacteroidales bacterium]
MNKENSTIVEKEQFTTPVIEIIELEMADIIATSGDGTPTVTNDDM